MTTTLAILFGVYLAMYPLGLWIASRVTAKPSKASAVNRIRKFPYIDSDAA